MRAARLVRTGTVYDLAHVLDAEVPSFPGRTFRQFLTTDPRRRVGRNEVNWIVEYVAAVHGRGALRAGEVITPADAEGALATAGLTVEPGDAVLFHTGWGSGWGVDNAAYSAGEPGPGMALGDWLVERRVAITGCDTWSYGPVPAEDPDEPFVVPQTLNTRHGVVVLENLRLAELAAAAVHEFFFVVGHAKLRGATGAWVAPLAIV